MGWTTLFPIDFTETGDTTSQAISKHILEFGRVYSLITDLFASSTGHNHNGSIDNAPQINTSGLAESAVTTEKMANKSVTTEKLADDINGSKLANSSITPSKLAAGIYVPLGGIIMWSGSMGGLNNKYPVIGGTVDTSWQLCDGSNGTPDLRDKFIVGAGISYDTGDTGGEATHILTKAEIPKHRHKVWSNGSMDGNAHGLAMSGVYGISGIWNETDPTSHAWFDTDKGGNPLTEDIGEGAAHENRPPYYALTFIQRVV